MNNNRLVIAAAGSGKTTLLVKTAIENPNKSILITTYTESNEQEIRDKFVKEVRTVPPNVTIITWFSFLLKHWVRPYQCKLNDSIANESIGFILVNTRSGLKYKNKDGKGVYWTEKDNFKNYYFTKDFKVYSDKISKFCFEANKASKQAVVNRISALYDMIFIDEVQDLAGFDLELIKLLFKSKSEVMLVGDPRQVTYKTHHTTKYSDYGNGNIKGFVTSDKTLGKRISCEVDETTLNKSHRCYQDICDYSSKLYPQFKAVDACQCNDCRREKILHQGVFIVPKHLCSKYLKTYQPMQLRWSARSKVNPSYEVMNFGESKGLTVDRAFIYPTKDMVNWIRNPDRPELLKNPTRARLYVALTRARHSVAIALDPEEGEVFEGATIYQ
ncbi:UvrD-helicase domain-containing protein [Vibrio vulnificus]|uniref:UvrD-helicase domain-containing protein n=3 Tax=Vibrio vulnificus TaxID=672 RepID=UPI00092951BE|nr:UvrD-helicase domain-containing protein [Vibrio vulnificus]EGR0088159.1 AAA family ATPase [Vibrio vulnificus]EHU5197668.1 UvrD-helicase domain-containing protein [Vibrio vulnificus]EIO4075643.1 UvrD-helicase domain-containing protein [Vibrio vulnificus]EJR3609205.1 UvrD-helicase domain-containing protein [Vibrio vulnificus]EJV9306867.1 UvrD-helicase domain-containing protein [Vibrio vulnificus]